MNMGCDIHTVVEYKRSGKWQTLNGPWLCYYCDGEGPLRAKRGQHECIPCQGTGVMDEPWGVRNYDVFGMLAGVRCDDWRVMSNDRGLPRNYVREGTPDDAYLGEHSFGHVTLDELQAYDWWQTAAKQGVVGISIYAHWNHITPPHWYSGGVSGAGIKNITCKEADKWLETHEPPPPCLDYFEPSRLYVHDCEWLETAAQRAGNFLTFVAEMTNAAKRLNVRATDVRLVFGFDS